MTSIEIGKKVPEFSLPDYDRKLRDLKSLLTGNLVLAFYPGAFTSVCTKEMCAFRDSLVRFNDLNATVVGISVNDPFTNKAFAEMNDLNFSLLSDYERAVVKKFGILLGDFAGLPGYDVAKRSVFIIDNKGVVRYKWVSEDPGKEPDYKEIEQQLHKHGW